jgi:hypothetical protein
MSAGPPSLPTAIEHVALGEYAMPASADALPTHEHLRMAGIAAEVAGDPHKQADGVWRLQIAAVDERNRLRAESAYDRAAAQAAKP